MGQGGRVEGGRFNNGTSEEGPERGMDGAREIKAVGSERRKEGAGGRKQPSEGEEQGRSEGRREQGRQGNVKGGTLKRILLKILVLQMKIVNWYINSIL